MKIQELSIYSKNLFLQKIIYSRVLGLSILEETEHSLTIKIGNSILKLIENENANPYHFAINIPANRENEALDWLKKRAKVLTYEEEEIQDFSNWNAKAIYFYDGDSNIVELIARKNLDNTSDTPFDSESLLEISEIGVPTKNIELFYKQLNAIQAIDIYDGSYHRFCAIGDEYGLFICIDENKKEWFPTNDPALFADFKIVFETNNIVQSLKVKNGLIV